LFFLNLSKSRRSLYHQAYYKAYRDLYSAIILISLGARNIGIKMFKKNLKLASQFHLTEIQLTCLVNLKHHSALNGKKKEYERYNEQFHIIYQTQEAEYKSWEMYEEITLHYARSAANTDEMIALSQNYCTQIDKLRKKYNTFTLNMNYFRVKIFTHQMTENFKRVVTDCNEGDKYLIDNPNLNQLIRRAKFSLDRMNAYMHLRDFKKGSEDAERCKEFYEEGSNNWMVFMEYYFLMAIQSGDIEKAHEICYSTLNHPRFILSPVQNKERWGIFEGYLKYGLESSMNKNLVQKIIAQEHPFNIDQFLKSTSIYSKDKKGLNISIIILHILFLLERGDFGGIIDRADAMKQYHRRYLLKGDNYRSYCFMNMLMVLESENFELDRIQMRTNKFYAKMTAAKMEYDNKVSDLEIIPYEQLWDNILVRLKEINVKQKQYSS
ncbi:MAG: hypothetical protein IIA45_12535, partial [Bacteroidetes bacterium]|nr:hypothetical protein [Bacteroidota bacterium]